MRTAGVGAPCFLVIGEAALAADLITGLVFEHLEQNLKAKATSNCFLIDLATLAALLLVPSSIEV